MFRTIANLSAVALLCGLVAGLGATNAIADETFVCDDGRVLTLRPEQVEALIETDPCIAKYYGREVKVPRPSAASPRAATPSPGVDPAYQLAPATPPVAAAPTTPPVALDIPLPERGPRRAAAKLRSLKVDPTAPAAERKPVAIADVPSDYRNVHIINAGDESNPAYFNHTR
ncbi:MAG: hypothetical protein RIC14_04365 [Filomicrobium sp.]